VAQTWSRAITAWNRGPCGNSLLQHAGRRLCGGSLSRAMRPGCRDGGGSPCPGEQSHGLGQGPSVTTVSVGGHDPGFMTASRTEKARESATASWPARSERCDRLAEKAVGSVVATRRAVGSAPAAKSRRRTRSALSTRSEPIESAGLLEPPAMGPVSSATSRRGPGRGIGDTSAARSFEPPAGRSLTPGIVVPLPPLSSQLG